MTGGGSRPRGGKMGDSIHADSVSGEAVANAEKELSGLVESLCIVRNKIADAVKKYMDSKKATAPLEMELAKSQKEIDSLKLLLSDLEKQLGSLKAASQPIKEEVNKLKELGNVIFAEEKGINRIMQGSKQLKEKAVRLQNKIENAGGERLKNRKAKVNKIQSDIDKTSTEINRRKVQIETGEKILKKLRRGIEYAQAEQCLAQAQWGNSRLELN